MRSPPEEVVTDLGVERRCAICGGWWPLDMFDAAPDCRRGRSRRCKACRQEGRNSYRVSTRSRTENVTRLSKKKLGRRIPLSEMPPRPRTRGDCLRSPRPCPWVGCRFNLYLDVSPVGNIKYNFPEFEPHQMKQSCALDVADGGPMKLEIVGGAMNVTRERARQIERAALQKISDAIEKGRLSAYGEFEDQLPPDPVGIVVTR